MSKNLTEEQQQELFDMIAKFFTENEIGLESGVLALATFAELAVTMYGEMYPADPEYVSLEELAESGVY
jgi:hypothetical protein